jgi:hypothetical protein
MVPLYAARVRDLGPDDVAVFKCGACGHTAELPPSALEILWAGGERWRSVGCGR